MRTLRRLPSLALPIILFAGPVLAADGRLPEDWLTVAERSGFRATSSYDQTVEMLKRIDDASPHIELRFFGRTGAGRLLPVVVLSGSGAVTPQSARADGRPVLLLVSCIHAGEVDGKDASLMILRDIAVGRKPAPERTVVLFVPIFNADGHERVSPYNRANQNGPTDGMGFRRTANGIDLNRDHLRVATVEMHGLLDLVNRWRPHLHVDNHVTNGSDHGWILTWMTAEAPTLSASVDGWLSQALGRVLAATEASGHPTGPYVDLLDSTAPDRGISWQLPIPRYSTHYFPLRNRPSILVEMHAHKPFEDRVLANRDFMLALIDEVERRPESLVRAINEAEGLTVAAGRPDAEPSTVVVRWRSSGESEPLQWPVARWTVEDSMVTGKALVRYRTGEYRAIEVPWYHGHVPELELPRPRGYLVPPGWPQIERLLSEHGLRAWRLPGPMELAVETIRVADPVLGGAPFQGTVLIEDFSVSRQVEFRTVAAGAIWVPADQPDFEVAVQLFEPEAPDSMLHWGLLSTVFERKEYIAGDTLEGLARDLVDDETVRTEWQTALQDEDFAEDARARYVWWYRRTPYWDEQVGLLPVFRVMDAPDLEVSERAYAFADDP
jgi:hypothetical protein